MGIIYSARNKINGRLYVGKTVKVMEQRRREHEYIAEKGSACLFHKALRKYGFDAFEWKTLMHCEDGDDLNESEIACIKMLKTKVPNGYNLTDGGDGGHGWPEEIRRRRSEKLKGRKHSIRHRYAISMAMVGKVKTKSHCEAVSKALKGRALSAEHVLALKMAKRPTNTPESNLKRSLSQKGKPKHSKESRQRIALAKKGQSSKLKGRTYDDIYGIDANHYRLLRSLKRNKTIIEKT